MVVGPAVIVDEVTDGGPGSCSSELNTHDDGV